MSDRQGHKSVGRYTSIDTDDYENLMAELTEGHEAQGQLELLRHEMLIQKALMTELLMMAECDDKKWFEDWKRRAGYFQPIELDVYSYYWMHKLQGRESSGWVIVYVGTNMGELTITKFVDGSRLTPIKDLNGLEYEFVKISFPDVKLGDTTDALGRPLYPVKGFKWKNPQTGDMELFDGMMWCTKLEGKC